MKIDLPYGDGVRSVMVPANLPVEYISPREVTGVGDLDDALERACSHPTDSKPLSDLIPAEKPVLLVTSDPTRKGGGGDILPRMINWLTERGVVRERISVLVARGTHRALSKQEREVFKLPDYRGVSVVEHDCDNAESLCALLYTKRGTPVRVNRLVRDAGLVVLLSSISFHYFAGFGGGRKLILPGSADRAAILANHRLSLIDKKPVKLHPSCRPGTLDGNPVHEDMCEPLDALDHLFVVNFFADQIGTVLFVNAGDPRAAHLEACDAYRNIFRVSVARRSPVIIASAGGHPYDINLLQTHKALRHAGMAASELASILLFAECREGIGSPSLAAALEKSRDEFLKIAYNNYALNNQTAVSLHDLTRKFRVGIVSELDEDTVRKTGMRHVANPEAFIAEELDSHGADRITVIRSGSVTLPFIPDKETVS